MILEEPIEWLRRQGHHIIKTQNSYWYDAAPKVYQAFPYHSLITPSEDEIVTIFKQSQAIAIRFSTPISQPEGQISYHVVYDRGDCNITNLHKKARHDVTRGLQYASYEVISFARLAQEGWNLRKETLIRQGRKNAESRSFWQLLCLSAEGLPGFEAWGALHEGALVTAIVACTIGDTVGVFYQQSLTEHLKFGINNALTYAFTCNVLNRPGVKNIFYGLQSLDAPSSVDDFKFRMGYSAKPVRQQVVFNPVIAPLIQPLSHSMLKTLVKIFPSNARISKTEGMVRFYLQGKRPLSNQIWPDILLEQKEAVLAMDR